MHKETTLQMVKKLFASMRHLMPFVYIAVTFAVLGFLAMVLIPAYLLYLVFDGTALSGMAFFVLVALGILRGLFRYGEHYYGHYVAFRVLADYRNRVFEKLRRLAPSKLDRQDSGILLKMIGEDIEALEVFFAHTIPPLLTASAVTVLIVVYFASVSLWVTLSAVVTYLLLAAAVPIYFARQLEPLLSDQRAMRKQYTSAFLESLRGMKELVQYQQVETTFDALNAQSQQVNTREKEVTRVQFVQTAVTFLIVGLAVLVVSSIALHQVMTAQLNLAQAVIAVVVFSTSFAPFLELSRLPLGFKRAINAGHNVFALLDEVEPVRSGSLEAPPVEKIVVDKIEFGYAQRETQIFDQLSAAFSGNRIIGIVGESGSGKSTLMKLLMRWYDVTKGDIIMNDVSIQEVAPQAWQTSFAYIPQIPQVFHQTIRENLTLGNADITDAQLWQVLENCRLKERVEQTTVGLNTLLNAEQPFFSAGELQRLELARAFLKGADCYIFDEPTSNLDSLNEAALLSVIQAHCKGLVFLISHRPSTTACADIVYRLANHTLIQVKGDFYETTTHD